MDDAGVADAFYTVLSIGIVLVAALAVSGVVLSATAGQGMDAGARLADYGAPGGLKPGIYSFYYAVDGPQSDPGSGDPDDIVLRRLASEGTDAAIAFNASTAPPATPETMGAVIWSGFLYAPADGDYELELSGAGAAWLWVDGRMAADNGFSDTARKKELTLELSKGHHAIKVKYFYPELSASSCTLSWKQSGRMVPLGPLYR
jgi:hypothetical protein